ncbi:hypothetical protein Cyrtocomes_01099 [Candidatus Cyrtobacter comes]|uniref:Uncharacterized protein n=1 Tax=Candidatus Cyrtobacter comes TaxID=675776 RepID=A0ABU5L9A4_9RICK|nr:hypothetical protein [Candidatus Cyrtobacter comes]
MILSRVSREHALPIYYLNQPDIRAKQTPLANITMRSKNLSINILHLYEPITTTSCYI